MPPATVDSALEADDVGLFRGRERRWSGSANGALWSVGVGGVDQHRGPAAVYMPTPLFTSPCVELLPHPDHHPVRSPVSKSPLVRMPAMSPSVPPSLVR